MPLSGMQHYIFLWFAQKLVQSQNSDGEIYSGAELTSWTFQWDWTLNLLIWTFYTWIDTLPNEKNFSHVEGVWGAFCSLLLIIEWILIPNHCSPQCPFLARNTIFSYMKFAQKLVQSQKYFSHVEGVWGAFCNREHYEILFWGIFL